VNRGACAGKKDLKGLSQVTDDWPRIIDDELCRFEDPDMISTLTRRALLGLSLVLSVGLSSCNWDGNFTILGYTTYPNYDMGIHTVRVPIFKNVTFYRGMEFDLTRAVIRTIEAQTPYKVVSCVADTELTGTIVLMQKAVINRNQQNEVREAQTLLAVDIVWKDLRPGHEGEILSRPRPGPGAPPPPPPPNLPPGAPPPEPTVRVTSTGDFIPEVGGSITTAQLQNVNRLAVQIVNMMEKPW
jgi:hypothetical protein